MLWLDQSFYAPIKRKIAVAMAITFLSGCRMQEALSVMIEDLKYYTNEEGIRYLVIPVRVSKTNPYCLTAESLHIPILEGAILPIADKVEYLKGGRSRGKLFRHDKKITTNKATYHMSAMAKK